MSAADRPTAAALIIGNEILTGKIADKNLRALALLLRRLGVKLTRAHTVLDDVATIAAEVETLRAAHTWLVTSGGVGPTHDDVTIEGVARAFGREVVVSAELEALLRVAYRERLTPGHLLMARIPDGAQLVKTADIPWPVVRCENVLVLPGVPEIFELKMRVVESEIGASAPFHARAVLVSLDEGTIKPCIDGVVQAFPAIEIGSYPRWGDEAWRTKITFDGDDESALDAALGHFVASLPAGAETRAPD